MISLWMVASQCNFYCLIYVFRGLGRSRVLWQRLPDTLKTTISYRLTDLPYFDVYDRIALLIGLSKMEVQFDRLPRALMFKITESLNFVDNCTAPDLSALTMAMGKLVGNSSPRLHSDLIASFVRRFVDTAHSMNHYELADALHGLSRIGYFSGERGHLSRLDRSEDAAVRSLPQQLCETVYKVFSSENELFLKTLRPDDLQRIVHSLSELRFRWAHKNHGTVQDDGGEVSSDLVGPSTDDGEDGDDDSIENQVQSEGLQELDVADDSAEEGGGFDSTLVFAVSAGRKNSGLNSFKVVADAAVIVIAVLAEIYMLPDAVRGKLTEMLLDKLPASTESVSNLLQNLAKV
jgi:hypothetical protein